MVAISLARDAGLHAIWRLLILPGLNWGEAMSIKHVLKGVFSGTRSEAMSLPQEDSPEGADSPPAKASKTFKAFVVGQLPPPMTSEKTRRALLPIFIQRTSAKGPAPQPPKPRPPGMLPLPMRCTTKRHDLRDIEGSTTNRIGSNSQE
jgi:hypothetical protein